MKMERRQGRGGKKSTGLDGFAQVFDLIRVAAHAEDALQLQTCGGGVKLANTNDQSAREHEHRKAEKGRTSGLDKLEEALEEARNADSRGLPRQQLLQRHSK